jgi:malonate-semialdehyde dehydrogenase (acetylating) / methylmalonate-semialdehyde dehydrogenase
MTDILEAPASTKQITHWIAGRAVAGTSGRKGAVYNPATGRQSGEVDFATVEEVDAAVQAAKDAFVEWRQMSLAKRADLFFRIRELIHERKEEAAKLLVAEHGKVLSDAIGEVTRGLEVIEYCCGLPTLLKSEFSEQASTGIDVYSIRQPLGVVAGITPFNFPAMVPMWMWAPAIACGNAFVLKPSEKDPSAALWTAELLQEAGLPDGVFNVVMGDKVAVDAILGHPDVAAVSFVGSTPIARYVYEQATATGKRCQALGGAKNHMIVLPDADVDAAADAAISAGYGSAGERCMAVSLVVAVGDVADPLVAAIRDRIPRVTVGDGMDPASEMGPLVTAEHRDKVASYLDDGDVVVDGREGAPADGFFLLPSLIDNVKPGTRAYDDEIFGPVLGVTRVATYDEAVRLVNESPYGNGVALFTRDGGVARRFQFEVEAGMVGINVPIPVPVAYYSFGGWGDSLFGDRHVYGPEAIDFYTRGKVVTTRWPDPATSAIDLGFPQTR